MLHLPSLSASPISTSPVRLGDTAPVLFCGVYSKLISLLIAAERLDWLRTASCMTCVALIALLCRHVLKTSCGGTLSTLYMFQPAVHWAVSDKSY